MAEVEMPGVKVLTQEEHLLLIRIAIEKTIESVQSSRLNLEQDYTVKDLSEVLCISESSARNITSGKYWVGSSVRFRRHDIDYLRKIGGRIVTETCSKDV